VLDVNYAFVSLPDYIVRFVLYALKNDFGYSRLSSIKCVELMTIRCTLDSLDMIAMFPDLEFYIGGEKYLVRALDLFSECVSDSLTRSKYNCVLGIVKSRGVPVFGIPFFNSNFVVFDKSNRRIGTQC